MLGIETTALVRVAIEALKWVEQHGLDPHELTRLAGIDRSAFDDPDSRIPIDQVWNLWRVAIERSDDPHLGLHLGSALRLRSMGLAGYAAFYAVDLGEALHRIARYSRIVNEVVCFSIVEEADGARMVGEHSPRFDELRHPVDLRLAVTLGAAREVTGDMIVPLQVGFPYPAPTRLSAYQQVFGCPLRFEQPAASILFRRDDLERKVAAGDGTLGHYLEQRADQVLSSLSRGVEFADRVRSAMWLDLSTGRSRIDSVARRIGVGPRSLQRRLHEENTSFTAELEHLRREMARRLLLDRDLAVHEVAFLLGFAEPSSFYRAFRRWESVSPHEYRCSRASARHGAQRGS